MCTLTLRVWQTQLADILSDAGHEVHVLISESYNRFEHHFDQTRKRHHCSLLDHLPFDDADNFASSCLSHNGTSASRCVKACPHCRRKVRLSPLSRHFLRQSHVFSRSYFHTVRSAISVILSVCLPVTLCILALVVGVQG